MGCLWEGEEGRGEGRVSGGKKCARRRRVNLYNVVKVVERGERIESDIIWGRRLRLQVANGLMMQLFLFFKKKTAYEITT